MVFRALFNKIKAGLSKTRNLFSGVASLFRSALERGERVVIERDVYGEGQHRYHAGFLDFAKHSGFRIKLCQPYRAQTKGKVERSVGIIKHSFWPGVCFTDLDDLNTQARAWCEQRNRQIHHTTHQRPIDRWTDEGVSYIRRTWVSSSVPVFGTIRMELTGGEKMEAKLELVSLKPATR